MSRSPIAALALCLGFGTAGLAASAGAGEKQVADPPRNPQLELQQPTSEPQNAENVQPGHTAKDTGKVGLSPPSSAPRPGIAHRPDSQDASKQKDAGYEADEMKDPGYEATETKEGGWEADEMREGGWEAGEMKD